MAHLTLKTYLSVLGAIMLTAPSCFMMSKKTSTITDDSRFNLEDSLFSNCKRIDTSLKFKQHDISGIEICNSKEIKRVKYQKANLVDTFKETYYIYNGKVISGTRCRSNENCNYSVSNNFTYGRNLAYIYYRGSDARCRGIPFNKEINKFEHNDLERKMNEIRDSVLKKFER
jgi:hypothetical protein